MQSFNVRSYSSAPFCSILNPASTGVTERLEVDGINGAGGYAATENVP